jgi:hypothetical protein
MSVLRVFLLGQIIGWVRGAVDSEIVTTQLKIGDSFINITKESFPPSSSRRSHNINGQHQSIQYAFLNLHENENTSVVATRAFLYQNGGSLVKFNHGSTRTISFYLNSTKYSFDPNRMFTSEGIIDTLKQYGPYSTAAADEVSKFASSVLDIYSFDDQTLVLALHNNAGTYGASSYLPGGSYEDDASAVFIEPNTNPSDFYYVVDPLYFDWFAKSGYNVVLQNNETVTNDGSLSYYCGLEGKSYINFESYAEYSSYGAQVVIQLDMLYAVKEMLEAASRGGEVK